MKNKKKQNKHISIPVSYEFDSVTRINPVISRYVIRVMYTGKNRNGSYFSKETVEKMLETVGGIPVIGQYSEKDGDFMAHGDLVFRTNSDGSLEIKNEGTEPYGFVDLKPNFWWSNHTDKDGVTREYLNLEVFLWTGRYEELKCLEEGKNNHSMEIEASGEFQLIDDEEYFVCDENTYFTGLCILGKEVEPCFEGSAIFPQFELVKKERMEELKTALANFNLEQQKQDDKKEPEKSEESTEPTKPVEPETVETTEDQTKTSEPEDGTKAEEFDLKTKYEDIYDKYTSILNEFSALTEAKKDLEQQLRAEKEKSNELNEKNIELAAANDELEKKLAKNDKEKLLFSFQSKLSEEQYKAFEEKLDEYDYSKLKMEILESSVEFLTKSSYFYKDYNSTIDTQEELVIEDGEEDWKKEVYARQQEDK